MLKYNTFRPDRYLRTKFTEGRFLLASENIDLELELLDFLRKSLENNVGDIAIQNAWKVSKYSDTQLLVSPGEAWNRGLLFELRPGSDWLLTLGIHPTGVTISDEPTGLGKLINFTTSSTPSLNYRIVITASEEIIDSTEDPFLQNVNIPEPTASKIRLVYSVNVVAASNQGSAPNYDTSSPIPYQGEVGAASIVNLSNTIKITPSGTNGYLVTLVPIVTSQQIDGRSAELVIHNTSGTNPIPNGTVDQSQFENGTFIDTLGNEYHINAIFNDTVANQVRIRVSYEVGQSAPVIPGIGGPFSPYYIKKQDVYYADDTTGAPTGSFHWHIAEANWNTTNGFVHTSVVKDIRTRIISEADFETLTNTKSVLKLTRGGYVSLGVDGQTLTWSDEFDLVNPSGPIQIISASNALLVSGGTLTYTLNTAGGTISLGNQAVTVSSNVGSVVNFSGSPSLASVRLGNVIKVGNQNTYITAIDDINKNVTVASALTNTGSATIYLDSFGPGTVKLDENTFVLATLIAGRVVVGDALSLGAGESNALYDERVQFPTGLAANTNIVLPSNTITGLTQFYDSVNKKLMVFQNQLMKFQGIDWISIDPQTIQFNYALPNNTEVHFRIESFPAGSIGNDGSNSLQSAYNNGNTIVTSSGSSFTVSGSAPKVATFLGDILVTGVVDPTGVQLTPQSSNPLAGGQKGIWVDNSNNLMFEGSSSLNLSSTAGSSISALTGDVLATGPGSAPATVNTVGGSTAANVHSAELAANAATASNTFSTIVKRDGSGNFNASTITASLTGTASGNVVNTRNVNTTAPLTGGGTLSSDLTLAMPAANTSTNGYLTSTDWNTFEARGTIGGTINGTSGSVLFVDSSNNLAQNNSNLFWDNINFNLGIGTNTPSGSLEVATNESAGKYSIIASQYGTGSINNFTGRRARGTITSPTGIQQFDQISAFGAIGHDGTGFSANTTAAVNMYAAENWSSIAHGSLLTFRTTLNGNTTNNVRVLIDNTGFVSIGSGSTVPVPSMLSVGTTSQFQINSTGNITKLNNVTTSFPSTQGAAGTYAQNDGSGNISWSPLTYVDASTYLASGLAANTPITLPGSASFNSATAADIGIIVNKQWLEITRDFVTVGSAPYTSIQFNYTLPNDSVLRVKQVK